MSSGKDAAGSMLVVAEYNADNGRDAADSRNPGLTRRLLPFFDSLLESTCAAVCTWLKSSATAQDDPVLWSRLMETPFEDVRLRIIEQLQRRAARPWINDGDLASLWTGVLLVVHRGGRQKLKAIEQLTTAIAVPNERRN